MKGSFTVSVQNNRVKYEFTIRRNITIIQGNSATGKTTLIDLIREFQQNGADSGINLSCEKKCVVLEGNDWEKTLSLYDECIVFVDEGNRFIASTDFARQIKGSNNYYVLVTREGLENLPYSVEEIYGIHTSGKYAGLKQVYHEFYHIYSVPNDYSAKNVQKILTEDSNAGFEFFSEVSRGKIECESAGGKSNIFQKLNETSDTVLVIADGAAFGSQINMVMQLVQRKKNCILFLPESFEYLILQAELFKDSEIAKILGNPSDFIESNNFFSWEQFFTSVLIEKSSATHLKYAKKKLNSNYLSDTVKTKILNSPAMKEISSILTK